jgi:hypothetical protein
MATGMQLVEVGHAVDTEQHRFAIDHERAGAVLQRGLPDQGVALGPVVAVAGEQPYALALALDDQAIAVVLDLMEPLRPGGNLGSARRDARRERSFLHGN